MSFLSFHFVLEIYQKSQIQSFLCFPLLCVSPCFSFHSFLSFLFHSLKLWRIFNTDVNQPVKLLSPPVLVDSTRFSLYAIRKYRGSQSTHTLNLNFKTYTFCARFSHDQILVPLPGMGMVWFHIFVNLSSLFLACRLNF